MRTVSQKELQGLEKSGAKVKRKMGSTAKPTISPTQKPIKPTAQKAKAEVPMASMAASMRYLDDQANATRKVIAHNSAMIESFKKDLQDAVKKVQKRVQYVFDLERGKDKLLTRIVATPQED